MSGWLHPKFTIQNIGSVPRYFKHWLKYPRAWSGQIARLPNFSWMCSYSGTRMFCWEKGLKIRKKDISQKIAGNKKSRFWERIIIAPAGLERSLFICLLQGDFVENDLNLQKQHQKTSSWKCFTVYTPLWPLKYTGVPFDQCYNSVAEVLSSEMTCSAHAFIDDQMDMRLSGLWHNSITTYKPELQLISTYTSRPESIINPKSKRSKIRKTPP